MKIFLVLFLFSGGVHAQFQNMKLGTSEFYLHPAGSINPSPPCIPDPFPLPCVAPRPPTRIPLASIDSTLGNQYAEGVVLEFLRKGGYNPNPFNSNQIDNFNHFMKAVFVDAQGNKLSAGPRTTAPALYYGGVLSKEFGIYMPVNPPSDAEDTSVPMKVEIPKDAAAILFGSADDIYDPRHNVDPNGDNKVDITYPIVTADIYQVVQNPSFFPGRIDLVSGKNADLIVKLGPNLDFTGTTLVWQSTNPAIQKIFQPESFFTGNGHVLAYKFDPVPTEQEFLNGNTTMTLIVRRPDPDNGGTITVGTKIWSIRVSKTNPIRIAYIPISGCGKANECFNAASETVVDSMIDIAGPLTQIMYPVADSNFSSSTILSSMPLASDKAGIDKGVKRDLSSLNKIVYQNKLSTVVGDPFTHLVGVVDRSYFTGFHLEADTLGAANRLNKAAIVVQGVALAVPHELGHTFSLSHSNVTGVEGYSNDTIQNPSINIERGLRKDKKSLMYEYVSVPDLHDYWLTPVDYYTIYGYNLPFFNKKNAIGVGLRITGAIDQEGELSIFNTYYINSFQSGDQQNANLVVKVLDSNRNTIFTKFVKSEPSPELGGEDVDFDILTPINAVYISIFKLDEGNETKIGEVVIPADTLSEELKYIPSQAFATSASKGMSDLKSSIEKYRNELLNGQFQLAKQTLKSDVILSINNNLKSDFTSTSILDASKAILSELALSSLIRVQGISTSTDNTINSFAKLTHLSEPLVDQKSKIQIIPINKPSNNQYQYIYSAWFNGVKMPVKLQGSKFYVESPKLGLGVHKWSVQVYVSKTKDERAFNLTVQQYRSEIVVLQRQYDAETDIELRDAIFKKILGKNMLIDKILGIQQESRKELGNMLELSFEVL